MTDQQFKTKGTSALKLVAHQTQLALVPNQSTLTHAQKQDIFDYVFGYLHDHSYTSKVISILQNSHNSSLLGSIDKRFAFCSSFIATMALFAFSFITF